MAVDVLRVLRAQRERVAEGMRADARTLRDERAAHVGVDRPETYAVAVTPSNTAPLVPLPRERRRAYRARLAWLIDEAMRRRASGRGLEEAPYVDGEQTGALAELLGAGCTLCAGHCCRGGGTHAHLAIDTIVRWLDAHPDARPRDALAAYLAHLPRVSYADSCVHHTATGCTLPRSMRADVCNRFYCGALVSLQRAVAGGESRATFLAAGDEGTIHTAAFVDACGTRVVRERSQRGEVDTPSAMRASHAGV